MNSAGVSVIIPMKNVEDIISNVIFSAVEQSYNCNAEFIFIDMGSSDKTIAETYKYIKNLELNARIIQAGNYTVGSALNSGIIKASGEYITFLFPKRLYSDFIYSYYDSAVNNKADVVFGDIINKVSKVFKRNSFSLNGEEVLHELIKENRAIDIGCIMIRKDFIIKNRLFFNEDGIGGYSENFIMKNLLYAQNIVRLIMPRRSYEFEENSSKAVVGIKCFDKVKAVNDVYELVKIKNKSNKSLINAFRYIKLPRVILECIEELLNEQTGYGAIKGMLKVNGYDEFLTVGKTTPPGIAKKILVWNLTPWMYKVKDK